jgi:hypothetical protein
MNQFLTCSSGCSSSSAAPVRIGVERASSLALAFQIRKPKSRLIRRSPFTLTKRSFELSRIAANENN